MNNAILKFGAFATALFVLSCGDSKQRKELPPPGTVVATVSEPVVDDTLNKSTFSLKLVADSLGQGIYDVAVMFGHNPALGKFTMPHGIEDIVPSVRKGNTRYSYIIGFQLPGDTTFYEYYQVTSSSTSTKMQYINSYTFK